MTEFISSDSDAFVQKLECPVCLVTMRPPIFLCPTGHSICKKCYKSVSECPQCKVSYGKIAYDEIGDVVMTFNCPHGCRVSNGKRGNRHQVFGHGFTNKITCTSCSRDFSLVIFNEKLITEEEFEGIKAAYRPPQNYSLEVVTSLLLYPCESKQCKATFKLSEEVNHQATCIYRIIKCPSPNCDWKGPFNCLYEHTEQAVSDRNPPLVQLHIQAEKQGKFGVNLCRLIHFQSVTILRDTVNFPDSAFVFRLHVQRKGPLSISMRHYGTVASGKDIVGKVTVYSCKDPTYYLTRAFSVQNDLEAKTEGRTEELPSNKWMAQNGFFDLDHVKGINTPMMFEVDFWRKCSQDRTIVNQDVSIVLRAKEEPIGHGEINQGPINQLQTNGSHTGSPESGSIQQPQQISGTVIVPTSPSATPTQLQHHKLHDDVIVEPNRHHDRKHAAVTTEDEPQEKMIKEDPALGMHLRSRDTRSRE